MSAQFDVAAAGSAVAGPTTDTLTVPFSITPTVSGLLLAGFEYDTTAPSLKKIAHTVTHNGVAMKPIAQWRKGWGAPATGYVEVWGLAAEATGAHNVSVGLAYAKGSDTWAPAHATFSNFSGGAVSIKGASAWKEQFAGPDYRGASSRFISLGVDGFQNDLTIVVVGSDGEIDSESIEETVLFLDSGKHLLIAAVRGAGALKATCAGGNWGAVRAKVLPT